MRGGLKIQIDSFRIVPGDVIFIKTGDKIPADLRVLEATELKVDNSSLTGEPVLLSRQVKCTNKDNALETQNLCFFGTIVGGGYGKGIVIQTGNNTIIGKIANLA